MGGELLADYQYLAPDTVTTIQHRNPITGQWVKNAVRAELDPLGAETGYYNPYMYSLSYPDMISGEALYSIRGNAMDIRGGCAFGGMPISCSELHEQLGAGAIPPASDLDGANRRLQIDSPFRPLWPIDWAPPFLDWVARTNRQLTTQNYIELGAEWIQGVYQARIDQAEIEKTVLAALASADCVRFAQTILGAQKRKGLGTLLDVAKTFFSFSGARITRDPPRGSTMKVSNPIGRIKRRDAQIYSLGNDDRLSATEQMLTDADHAIGELFHLAAEGNYYTDEELARAVNNSSYASDAYGLMNNGNPLIDPRSNIFDRRYIPDKKDENDRENSFSRYFHTIQRRYCTSRPRVERGVGYSR